MLNVLLTRWARRRAASLIRMQASGRHSTQPGPNHLNSRTHSMPPGRSTATQDSIWQSLLRWMPGEPDPWAGKSVQPRSHVLLNNLSAARAQFQACMQGLSGDNIEELQRSVQRSRSLRDLWHLRTWLYTEVARTFSQQEAERRLQQLNALFMGGSQTHTAALAEGSMPAKRH